MSDAEEPSWLAAAECELVAGTLRKGCRIRTHACWTRAISGLCRPWRGNRGYMFGILSLAVNQLWSLLVAHVRAVFLDAPIRGCLVLVKPPQFLAQRSCTALDECWRFQEAFFGLRRSPSVWVEERYVQECQKLSSRWLTQKAHCQVARDTVKEQLMVGESVMFQKQPNSWASW